MPVAVLHNHFDLWYVIKSLFFVPAFNPAGEVRPFHSVGLTLLHEMFFYLTFAAAMALGRKPQLLTSAVIVGLWLLGIVFTPETAFQIVVTHPVNLCFVCGMLLGTAIMKGPWHSGFSLGAMGLCVAGAIASLVGPQALAQQLPDVPALLFGCVMLVLCTWRIFRVPIALGNSSYALYLFHPLLVSARSCRPTG